MGKRNYFSGKNFLIYILVAYAFYYLYKYRQNDPPPLYTKVPNFALKTLNGKTFTLYDIKLKKVIIFLNKNNIYSVFYKKNLSKIKHITDKKGAYLIVFVKTKQTPQSALNYISNKHYKPIEKDLYLVNISEVEGIFGINSWPFLVILDEHNKIIYASKIPALKEIEKIL